MHHRLAVLAAPVLALAVTIGGCARLGYYAQELPPAEETPQLGTESSRARALAAAMAQRERSLDSMQTAAVMEYSGPGEHIKAREQIVVRRPGSLRIEARSPFGVALVVVANDSRLRIFAPSEDKLFSGRADASTLNRFAHIPLGPGPAAKLLLGLAPDGEALSRPPDAVRLEGDLLVATYRLSHGAVDEFGFSASQLTMVRYFRRPGELEYEVRYQDFRDIGGLMFAHLLEADFPRAGTHVKFQYQRPIVNGTVASSIFTIAPGPNTKEIDLDGAVVVPTLGSNG